MEAKYGFYVAVLLHSTVPQQKLHIFQQSISTQNLRTLHYLVLVSIHLRSSRSCNTSITDGKKCKMLGWYLWYDIYTKLHENPWVSSKVIRQTLPVLSWNKEGWLKMRSTPTEVYYHHSRMKTLDPNLYAIIGLAAVVTLVTSESYATSVSKISIFCFLSSRYICCCKRSQHKNWKRKFPKMHSTTVNTIQISKDNIKEPLYHKIVLSWHLPRGTRKTTKNLSG